MFFGSVLKSTAMRVQSLKKAPWSSQVRRLRNDPEFSSVREKLENSQASTLELYSQLARALDDVRLSLEDLPLSDRDTRGVRNRIGDNLRSVDSPYRGRLSEAIQELASLAERLSHDIPQSEIDFIANTVDTVVQGLGLGPADDWNFVSLLDTLAFGWAHKVKAFEYKVQDSCSKIDAGKLLYYRERLLFL